MPTEQEIINEQRQKIEALEKQLADGLPKAEQLNDLLSGFTKSAMPGVEGINKVVKDLERTAKSFEGMQELLSKMTKKDVEKVMKRQAKQTAKQTAK